jgi:uncharacterized protein YjdB
MDRTTKGRRKRNLWLSLSIVVIFLSSVSCDAGAFVVSIEALPDDLLFSLSPSEMTLAVGESATITASLAKANGTPVNPQALKWTSTGRATVTPDGVVTGVAQGHALIVASSGNLADTAWLRIVEQREARVGVKISPDTVVLQWLNATATLTAEVRDDAGTLAAQQGLTWRSLNPEIAQTNDMGVVTAKGVGMALIVATAVCCDQADTAYARVEQVVDEVKIEQDSVTLSQGSSTKLKTTAYDRGGSPVTGAKFEYRSSDTGVAQVAGDGTVKGESAGTTTVSATSEQMSDHVRVSVTEAGTSSGAPPTEYPNEPAGLSVISENRGAPWPSDWGLHNPNGLISVISDPGAPIPSWETIRYRFPKGHPGGNGVGIVYHGVGNVGHQGNMKVNGGPVRELYVRTWIKYSPNWQQPDNGQSKIFYTYQYTTESRNAVIPIIEGRTGADSFGTAIHGQTYEFGADVIDVFRWNVEWVGMKKGQWHLIEFYSRAASSEGARDGIVRWWIDGVLVSDHINVRRSHHPFTEFHGNPVWGGSSELPVQEDLYIYFNGLYLSGR